MFREPFSTNVNTINSRNKKLKKLMSKEDYEEHLRQMREYAKKNNQKKFQINTILYYNGKCRDKTDRESTESI